MNVKDKIKKYLKIKGISAVDFEKNIGAANGYVNSITKGIGGKKLEKIRELYPDLDTVALFDSTNDIILIENNHDISIDSTDVSIIKNKVNVPYYDVDFAGGWGSAEINKNISPLFYITNPEFEKAEFACNLVGQSISRRIPDGSVIGMREIYEWQIYFPTNEIYGVVLKNDLRTVKIVKRSKENKDTLILVPDPLDQYNQTNYEPEEVPINFVERFYQVVAWGTFKKIAM